MPYGEFFRNRSEWTDVEFRGPSSIVCIPLSRLGEFEMSEDDRCGVDAKLGTSRLDDQRTSW